jgi:hypothetical protein
MQTYWLIGGLISLIILLNANGENMDIGAALILLIMCLVVPTLVLGKMFRLNLFDLILSTMRHSS